MKETLEKRIESEILIMIERCNVLEKHILGYLAAGNYYDAAINKTKKETIMLVIERLQVAIEKSH